jgi:hypothetical protein
MVLFWFVGLLFGLAWWASQHFESRGTAWEAHLSALIPLASTMLAGGVLVLMRGWPGVIAGVVTAALLVGYLLLTLQAVTGGLVFAVFILGCALANAAYFRRAAL